MGKKIRLDAFKWYVYDLLVIVGKPKLKTKKGEFRSEYQYIEIKKEFE